MTLETALSSFNSQSLLTASRGLFKDTLHIPLSPLADAAIEPKRFFRDTFDEKRHSGIEKLYLVGRVDDRCFQPAKEHAAEEALSLDTVVEQTEVKDYSGMFIVAAELGQSEFSRSDLAARTREINRVFSNPVIVIFKHQLQKDPVISMGVIGRREHKRDKGKDVLGQVSMIREIQLQNPHRGHLEILKDFSLVELEKRQGRGKRGQKIDSFKAFHAALQEVFNTELLNKRFYNELANWYFWALPQVGFPADLEQDDEKRRATGLIRLLTRLIFCWFLKEKGLVPENLFQTADLQKVLKGFDPESETSSTYYQAILQNLFFATLNQRMGKDSKGVPHRGFARDEGFHKNKSTYDVNNLYRYEKLFAVPEAEALALFADIPFLNGGLFECLDRTEEETEKKRYLDGFSRNAKKRPHIPDRLFFDSGETADLSTAYGDKKRKVEKVSGLISILNRYKFTIVENTPIDQEIALDPELLGKVFENLLASYNEETKTTARKQTGSFYTPRPIVDYMVDECLKAHLEQKLIPAGADGTAQMKTDASSSVVKDKLDQLFSYTEERHQFSDEEVANLITAIDEVKILDPACGSGAFPMGVLHKLVYLLTKLDPDNERWKQTQLAKLDSAPMREQLEAAFTDNDDDYGRKLYLIENCLYGVDIQPIAIQISKLRFFISLVCDQKTNRNKKDNHGIRPLPNLETKFVAADTLIGLPELTQSVLVDPRVAVIEKEIESLYHSHFSEQNRTKKLANQRKVKILRQNLAKLLAESLMSPAKSKHVAEWDPFNPQSSADFFDPHWMFGRSVGDGFDIVTGNPPYVTFKGKERVDVSDAYIQALLLYYPNSAEYKINSYALFIDRGLRLLNKNGMLSFIIPSTLLQNESLEKTRRLILGKHKLSKLLILETKVFAAVTDSIVVFVSNSSYDGGKTAAITANSVDLSDLERNSVLYDQMTWLKSHAAIINTKISLSQASIIDSIENGSLQLGTILKVYVGIVASGMKKFLSSKAVNENYRKYLQGRDIGKFTKSPRELFINFDKERLHSNTDESVYLQNEKILVRKTGNFLLASYDDEQYFTDQSIYNLYAPNEVKVSLKTILCFLNSSVLNFYFRKKMITNPDIFPYIKGIHLKQLPIKKHTAAEVGVFERLVPLIQFAKADAGAIPGAAIFLSDLIDACVMESYFREHMAERDLLFHDTLAPHLATYSPEASEAQQRDFLTTLHQTLNAPSHPIRQRLDRICTASPDLLAVIKQDGKV